MAYVVRTSERILEDVSRGFSCFMGVYPSAEHTPQYAEAEARLEEKFPFAESEEIREMALDAICGEFPGGVVELAPAVWAVFHHEGLSCYRLEADTKEAALAEARQQSPHIGGDGDATVGAVRLIASWRRDGCWMHLLECEDVRAEN